MNKLSARFPVDLPAWQQLKQHQRESIAGKSISELFKKDSKRSANFSLRCDDLVLDYSRHLMMPRTRQLLLKLAEQAGVAQARDEMFAGELINNTEQRAALHAALRGGARDKFDVGGEDVSKGVLEVREQMLSFVQSVHDGGIRGSGGQRFTDVINIGIGGSDLGIVMATKALAHVATGVRVHAVSNVDGTQLADLAKTLDAKSTLIVVCSKTFTTQETMSNAHAARAWIVESLGEASVSAHFAAASTNHAAMDSFGIHPHYRFGFWDWVGGRYSLWSAVGLSIALAVGVNNFRELLSGARAMDKHFCEAPLAKNMPTIMALVAVWNNNFLGAATQAILPYDNRLERFPAYLQQLQMESNGKRVRRDGKAVRCKTGAIIWGEAGSNAQHSFYQLLHQGTRLIPADFLLPVRSSGASQTQQDLAIANCLAQADALMQGFSLDEAKAQLRNKQLPSDEIERLAPHKVHKGNRPSNLLMFKQLDAFALGQLVALYEHKVFVESVIWGINPFDQWGVELGKVMASDLLGAVSDPKLAAGSNASTFAALSLAKRWRR